MKIYKALKISAKKLRSKKIRCAALDAEVLMMEALNRLGKNVGRSWIYSNGDYVLKEKERKLFSKFINQREKRKPVAYIINRKEFYGYDFYVNNNVLIPRPETELIVEEVLKIINKIKQCNTENVCFADIGAGSGCIAASILNELEKRKKENIMRKTIVNDISKKAIRIAKINIKKYKHKKIKFIIGDFEKAINKEMFLYCKYTIISANLPYVKNCDYIKLPLEIKKYEPKIALFGGKLGLDHIERLIYKISRLNLKNTGNVFIVLEMDPRQTQGIKSITKKYLLYSKISVKKDLSGIKRAAVISF